MRLFSSFAVLLIILLLGCLEKKAKIPDYKQANIAYDNGKFDSAIVLYSSILKEFPDEYLAYYFRAGAKTNLNDYKGAIKDYTSSIEIRENDLMSFMSRGICYSRIDSFKSAKNDFRKAIEINPKYFESYENIGYLFFLEGQFDSALAYYNQSLKIQKRNLPTLFDRAKLYDSLKMYDKAISDCDTILSIDTLNSGIYKWRGELKQKAGDKKGAAEDLEMAKNLDDNKNQ